MPKKISFSEHALSRLPQRGVTRREVEITINTGERLSAKRGRIAFRKNFSFASKWKNRYHEIKQVTAIVIEEGDTLVVVTIYAFYFGGTP
jgi:hypothetical protein